MKFVVFNEGRPGLLTDKGVVDVTELIRPFGASGGQDAMRSLIGHFDDLRPDLERRASGGQAIPLTQVELRAPTPRAKVLNMGGNYREFGAREPAPMWGFLKSTDAIIGSGGTVVLPDVDANIFHHEAELVIVFGRAGHNVPQDEAMDYVFGYTCGVDVSARMPPTAQGGGGGPRGTTMPISLPKSHPTFAPLGPWIVTKDEIPDPHHLDVKLWVSEELRGAYNTSDLAHSIPESIAWATAIEEVSPGDVLFMGTNHQGLGAMQDRDKIEMEIGGVGRLTFSVSDSLRRRWPRGVDEVTAQDVRNGTGGPGSKARPL